MFPKDLQLWHLCKRGNPTPTAPLEAPSSPIFFDLDTCQRRIQIVQKAARPFSDPSPTWRCFEGRDAYEFLLRIACGLESEVLGETDVFGQLKQAWAASPSPELQGLMQALFEDTKEIRSQFLQGLGGNSYGTLVRRLLELKSGQSVLVLGAGQIARSIVPYLSDARLFWWNRSAGRLRQSLEECIAAGLDASRVDLVHNEKPLKHLLERASAVVLAVPARADQEGFWISTLRCRSDASSVRIIHLGGRREETAAWSCFPGYQALDDLFEAQECLSAERILHVKRATKACHDKALLRSMGGSASLAHGWEDLAVFA